MFQKVTLLDVIDFVTASDSDSGLLNDESNENHICSS